MTSNREDKNRVLGFAVGSGPRNSQHEEQHVMGFPASWFDDVNVDVLFWLVHPVREYRRWARRRRLGSDAPGEDER